MDKVPRPPRWDEIARQEFPDRAHLPQHTLRWGMTTEEHYKVANALRVKELEFDRMRKGFERYFTMIGGVDSHLSVTENGTPEAQHIDRRKLRKNEVNNWKFRQNSRASTEVEQEQWNVSVPAGDLSPSLRAAGYVLFTEHGSNFSRVLQYMKNEAAPLFFKAMEPARVSNISGAWHSRDVTGAIGANWIANLAARKANINKTSSQYERENRQKNWDDFMESNAVFLAIEAIAHGIDPWDVLPIEHADAIAFANRYTSQITLAVNGADDNSVMQLAIELAIQHQLETPPEPPEPPEPPPPPPGDDEPGGNGGGVSSAPVSDGIGEEDSVQEDSSEADGEDSSDAPDTYSTPSNEGEGEDEDEGENAEPDTPDEQSQEDAEREQETRNNLLNDFRKAQGKAKGANTRRKNRLNDLYEAIGNVQVSYVGDHKIKIFPTPDQEPITGSTTKLNIAQLGGADTSSFKYIGMPSQKTWQLSYGNTRVFTQRAKTRGRIGVLIDISGSMGCACVECYNQEPNSRAALAYIAAKTFAELDNDAIVAAYCGTDEIYRLTPGKTLTHKAYQATGGATPTCVALEWLEKAMESELGDAFCVLITDGLPNVCGAGYAPSVHTDEIANRMHNAGMKFGCVIIGRGNRVGGLPNPVTARLRNQSDLGNLQQIIDAIGGR